MPYATNGGTGQPFAVEDFVGKKVSGFPSLGACESGVALCVAHYLCAPAEGAPDALSSVMGAASTVKNLALDTVLAHVLAVSAVFNRLHSNAPERIAELTQSLGQCDGVRGRSGSAYTNRAGFARRLAAIAFIAVHSSWESFGRPLCALLSKSCAHVHCDTYDKSAPLSTRIREETSIAWNILATSTLKDFSTGRSDETLDNIVPWARVFIKHAIALATQTASMEQMRMAVLKNSWLCCVVADSIASTDDDGERLREAISTYFKRPMSDIEGMNGYNGVHILCDRGTRERRPPRWADDEERGAPTARKGRHIRKSAPTTPPTTEALAEPANVESTQLQSRSSTQRMPRKRGRPPKRLVLDDNTLAQIEEQSGRPTAKRAKPTAPDANAQTTSQAPRSDADLLDAFERAVGDLDAPVAGTASLTCLESPFDWNNRYDCDDTVRGGPCHIGTVTLSPSYFNSGVAELELPPQVSLPSLSNQADLLMAVDSPAATRRMPSATTLHTSEWIPPPSNASDLLVPRTTGDFRINPIKRPNGVPPLWYATSNTRPTRFALLSMAAHKGAPCTTIRMTPRHEMQKKAQESKMTAKGRFVPIFNAFVKANS
jgi:hypothetical protein